MNLSGKTAVVTGATSGIGLAVAGQLVQAGANVTLVGIDVEKGSAALAHLHAPEQTCFVRADVADIVALEAGFEKTQERFGGLDLLVNNAGVLGGPRFPNSKPEHWLRAISTNQMGVLNGIHLAARFMKGPGGGAIVSVASTSGLTPNPVDPIYAMTKAGVVNLTRSLIFMKQEFNIRLNCVCPGLVATSLEDNTAQFLNTEDRDDFKGRRAGRTSNPSLSANEVAQAVLGMLIDDSLNGYCLRITHGKTPELIPSVEPHKMS